MSVDLTFVPATEADSDWVSDVILGEPGQVTTDVAMRLLAIDDFTKARRAWRFINRRTEPWRYATIARSEEERLGVLTNGSSDVSISLPLLLLLLRLFGPLWLVRLRHRMALQRRVQTDRIEGAYRVSELHVTPSARGHGIGSALLAEAERQARAGGFGALSLQVLTENPAIHLYRRFGFEVIATRTDPEYEAVTGVGGYHRMAKHLT